MELKAWLVVILSGGVYGVLGKFYFFIWVLVTQVCLDWGSSLKCLSNDLCTFLCVIVQ